MQVGDKFYAPGHPLRRTVQSITTNADTSKTFNLGIDPDDNPADPAYDLNTQITRLGDAHQQSIRTGAKYTSTAYGLYGEAAKFLAMGPLSELGSAALGTIAEEAGGLLNAAREAEKVAQADATLAAEARTIAAEARQAEQGLTDVQQVAALEQKAVDAGQKATQLEAEAAEAESLATSGGNMAEAAQADVQEAKAIQQATVGNSAGLPATTQASVDKKLADYLLSPTHPIGSKKAKWFEKALGFTRGNMGQLAQQIVFNEAQAVQTGLTQFGTKFKQTISIIGANGKVIDVTFAWIRNNDEVVRLVTAIPTAR